MLRCCLVHSPEMADRHVHSPSEAVSMGDVVKVTILGVDWRGWIGPSQRH
ncbi:MAG TPA: S1 RNA-binding domain-containing protein [Chromatiaceae bacterium]|nr:S1 RNA-binding domain-containing protein [Chromatiaceae bacterium]